MFNLHLEDYCPKKYLSCFTFLKGRLLVLRPYLRTRIIVFTLVLTLSGCDRDPAPITVVSMNIRADYGQDTISPWETRKPLVSWFLRNKNPDIAGLQEVTKSQLISLKLDLPQYSVAGEGRSGPNDPGEFNPIFFNTEKFSLLAKSQFWLSENPENIGSVGWDSYYPRIVTWVKLKNKTSGHIFFVFNTQFSQTGQKAREESAKLMILKIKTIADNTPVLLTGDFNVSTSNEIYKILTGNYNGFYQLNDSYSIAENEPTGSPFTYHGFSDTEGEKTEYIFVNGHFSVLTHETVTVKHNGIFISDHNPIVVRLKFTTKRRSKRGPPMQIPSYTLSASKHLNTPALQDTH
jgi:endonuclease/exonuclease/phosphatase family metal-dependent hydrolase